MSTETPTTKAENTLPAGITAEEAKLVADLMSVMFPGKKSHDEIKSSMFEKGIPFSKLNKLFKYVGTQMGFLIDAAEVKKALSDELNSSFYDFTSYAAFEAAVRELMSTVPGTTEAMATKALAQYCIDNEIEVPAKPKNIKAAGRMGKLNRIYIELFRANKKTTKQEMYEALVGVVKTDKNAQDYTNSMHATLFAVANGLSVEDAVEAVKNMKIVPINGAPAASEEDVEDDAGIDDDISYDA